MMLNLILYAIRYLLTTGFVVIVVVVIRHRYCFISYSCLVFYGTFQRNQVDNDFQTLGSLHFFSKKIIFQHMKIVKYVSLS